MLASGFSQLIIQKLTVAPPTSNMSLTPSCSGCVGITSWEDSGSPSSVLHVSTWSLLEVLQDGILPSKIHEIVLILINIIQTLLQRQRKCWSTNSDICILEVGEISSWNCCFWVLHHCLDPTNQDHSHLCPTSCEEIREERMHRIQGYCCCFEMCSVVSPRLYVLLWKIYEVH